MSQTLVRTESHPLTVLGSRPKPTNNNAPPLSAGLTSDDANLHEERLTLWTNFNHAWLSLLQQQKDFMESGSRSQGLISEEGLEKIGRDMVRLCDSIERHGLVDYQYGVWEEQIIASESFPLARPGTLVSLWSTFALCTTFALCRALMHRFDSSLGMRRSLRGGSRLGWAVDGLQLSASLRQTRRCCRPRFTPILLSLPGSFFFFFFFSC